MDVYDERLLTDTTLEVSFAKPVIWELVRERPGLPGDMKPSLYSPGPAQALKTTSRMDGVKSDSVLCESVNVASCKRFFLEKRECISTPESRDKDAISAEDNTFPEASTGSSGAFSNGSCAGPVESSLSVSAFVDCSS